MGSARKYSRRSFLLLVLLGFLLFYNIAIVQKERLLAHGAPIVLGLAPVDPRSIMQGDYMVLEFSLEREVRSALRQAYPDGNYPRKGRAVLLEQDGEHVFGRLYNGKDVHPGERLLEFTVKGRRIKIAGGSFFFEEGLSRLYDQAAYAEIRADNKGKGIITRLLDDDKQVLDKSRWDANNQRVRR